MLELSIASSQSKELSDQIRNVIRIQRGWYAFNLNQDAENGFLATVFEEHELKGILDNGGKLVLARDGQLESKIVGFALLADAGHFTSQLGAEDLLKLSQPIDFENSLYLYQLAIESGLTRSGIGTAMVAKLLEGEKGFVFADYLIEPQRNIASERFFEKNGFLKCGQLRLAGYRKVGQLVSQIVGKKVAG